MEQASLGWLLALLAICGAPAQAAEAPVDIESMTWTEVKAALDAGHRTIIIPVGGTEQNGPDMALGKHNARAARLAERIARSLGDALVAPVVAYVPEGSIDPPAGHMRFAGTISISDATFAAVLYDAAASFKAHGFTQIVFIGDHGGYQADLVRVAARLNRQWAGSAARAHAIGSYYEVTQHEYVEELRRRGFSAQEIGTHAGLADASLTLALAPDLVRLDDLATREPSPALGEAGDPRRASAALGEIGVALIVQKSVAAIRAARSGP